MDFMQWIRSWWEDLTRAQEHEANRSRKTRQHAANELWLAQEEQQQLLEVRERLERLGFQLETITRRIKRGDEL